MPIQAIRPTSSVTHSIYDIVGPLTTLCARIKNWFSRKQPLPANLTLEQACIDNAGKAWRSLVTSGAWLGSAAIQFAAGLKPVDDTHHVLSNRLDWTSLDSEDLPDLQKGGSVLVPLIIRGGLFDSEHIVWVGCRDNASEGKELFYYDSKGKEPTLAMQYVVAQVAKKYGIDQNSLIVNPVRHQLDSHNCGTWGLQLLKEIQTGSFEAFLQKPKVDIERARLDFASEIVNHYTKP